MKIKTTLTLLILPGLFVVSCMVPMRSFHNSRTPSPPDYTHTKYWAALPNKQDSADFQMPEYGVADKQNTAKADVFFIPPTNYISGRQWNVSVEDSVLNSVTDNIGCRLLASAFNGSCKVYAPRYRAAILFSYFARKKNAELSFKLAYEDVKTAFLYYLEYYNKGRPLIIASHSQGTDYAVALVKQFFDKDTSLRKKLVAAYLIGRPIYDTTFKKIKVMDSPEQTGGYVTWNSVSYRTNTFYGDPVGDVVGVNPLSWKRDTAYVPETFNKGGLPFTADRIDSAIVDAKLAPSGFLWVHPPLKKPLSEYPGINTFYYHKDDYPFFYMNIRENVKQRVEMYIKQQKN